MHRLKTTGVLAFLSLCSLITTRGQTHKPILPLAPAELLSRLPAAPKDWRMTESSAKSFFMSWVCVQATREFQRPAPQSAPPTATPPKPYLTRVRLMDTGYFPSFNGDFENFRPGKYSNAESLMISGMPARKITISPTRERLRISIRGRFIVEIETDNQPPDSGKAWLPLIDFQKIAALPDSGSDVLPKPITVQVIDELYPAKNATSQLHWGGPSNPKATEP